MLGAVLRGRDHHGPAQHLVVSAVTQSPLPDAIAHEPAISEDRTSRRVATTLGRSVGDGVDAAGAVLVALGTQSERVEVHANDVVRASR